jgi:Bacterial SH3 domain
VREVNAAFSITRFIEEEALPSDAEVIGRTWKKANKDGSPDRRFANNYEIPIVRYGELRLKSATGINEAYLLSDAAAAEAFAATMSAYQAELSALAKRSRTPTAGLANASDASKSESEPDPLARPDDDLKPLPKPRVLVADGGVLVAAALVVAFLWQGPTFLPHTIKNGLLIETKAAAAPALIKAAPIDPKPGVIVKAASANIRAEPSTNAKIVKSSPKGARFDVLGHEGDWVKVGNNAAVGWVHGSLIEDAAPE